MRMNIDAIGTCLKGVQYIHRAGATFVVARRRRYKAVEMDLNLRRASAVEKKGAGGAEAESRI